MNRLIVLMGLLSATAGLAQQTPPKKQADSLRNQDNMPVVPNRGGNATMPVLKKQGDALPMPNAYKPTAAGELGEEALRALRDQFNKFKADSMMHNPALTPKKEKRR